MSTSAILSPQGDLSRQTPGADSISRSELDTASPDGFVAHLEQFRPFIQRTDEQHAGRHIILELWGAARLDHIEHIDAVMRQSISLVGATLLHLHLHQFNGGSGISGIAVLAESHLSIHTWPEWEFAALDMFVCGDLDPRKVVPVLRAGFSPRKIELAELWRGQRR